MMRSLEYTYIIISLIQLSSGMLNTSVKRAKLVESTTGESSNPTRLIGYEDQKEDVLNHLRPDLDQSHVKRVFESNENGPYLWEHESFKSNTHVSWKAMDELKNERSQFRVGEKVAIILAECAELKRTLTSHSELLMLVKNHLTKENAFHKLDDLLNQISDITRALFYKETQETLRIHGNLDEPTWKIYLPEMYKILNELEHILLTFKAPSGNIKNEIFHIFINQAIRILNFLIMNNLTQERELERLVSNQYFKNMVSNYICMMFSTRNLLHLEFNECIMKSESTKQLAFIFKLFQEDFFKDVEYQLLEMRVSYLGESSDLPKEVREAISIFHEGCFERNNIYAIFSREDLIKILINLFNTLNFDGVGIQRDYTFGIIYHMIYFAMRHFPEMFKQRLGDEKACHLLSMKMNILNSILTWFRSTKEIEFIASKGFWTSEISHLASEGKLPLEQVRRWKPMHDKELDHFKKTFACYTSRDYDEWKNFFKDSSLKRIQASINSNEIDILKYNNQAHLTLFNIDQKIQDLEENFHQYQKNNEYLQFFLKTFLGDLNAWIQKMKLLFKRNKENNKIWNEIDQKIKSGIDSYNLKGWFESSQFISEVFDQLNQDLNTSKYKWNRWKEILKEKILLLIHSLSNEITQNPQEELNVKDTLKDEDEENLSNKSKFQFLEEFIIPDIDF